MANKEYCGLQAEIIDFGENSIDTQPVGYSGCVLGTVEVYTQDPQGNPAPYGACWDDVEEDFIYSWGSYKNRPQ